MYWNHWSVCIYGPQLIRSSKCVLDVAIKNANSYSKDRYQNIYQINSRIDGMVAIIVSTILEIQLIISHVGIVWMKPQPTNITYSVLSNNRSHSCTHIIIHYIVGWLFYHIEKRARIKFKLNNFIWLIYAKLYGVRAVDFIKS